MHSALGSDASEKLEAAFFEISRCRVIRVKAVSRQTGSLLAVCRLESDSQVTLERDVSRGLSTLDPLCASLRVSAKDTEC